MSSIGSASMGLLNTVGSLSAAQRNDAGSDRSKAEASQERLQADQEASLNEVDLDVAEADLDSDRDADGRQGYLMQESSHLEQKSRSLKNSRRPPDAFDERGTTLDLEA